MISVTPAKETRRRDRKRRRLTLRIGLREIRLNPEEALKLGIRLVMLATKDGKGGAHGHAMG